ncbi:hypothetical protein ALT785_770084 [Alteromonas infernus]
MTLFEKLFDSEPDIDIQLDAQTDLLLAKVSNGAVLTVPFNNLRLDNFCINLIRTYQLITFI